MKVIRAIICILLLVSVAPISAATTLVVLKPDMGGGAPTVVTVLLMALFGLFTVPLWITYVPALIATPFVMHRLARSPSFQKIPLAMLVTIALPLGTVAGLFVLAPVVVMALNDSGALAFVWMTAGAVAGAITFPLIVTTYRLFRTPTA